MKTWWFTRRSQKNSNQREAFDVEKAELQQEVLAEKARADKQAEMETGSVDVVNNDDELAAVKEPLR